MDNDDEEDEEEQVHWRLIERHASRIIGLSSIAIVAAVAAAEYYCPHSEVQRNKHDASISSERPQ